MSDNSDDKKLARCFVEIYAEKEALKSKLQKALEQNESLIRQLIEKKKNERNIKNEK